MSMITKQQAEAFGAIGTPFYFYDMDLLRRTLAEFQAQARHYGYRGHYALKANAEPRILEAICEAGLGADCVSGGEVALALKSGFAPEDIVMAGVGKTDREILTALEARIGCLNCESVPELKVVNDLAAGLGLKARIALRVNPGIDAHTHSYISTGLTENKFGIGPNAFQEVVDLLPHCPALELIGLHVHVGSQITEMPVFARTCRKLGEIQLWFHGQGVEFQHLDLGGGLGVNYQDPEAEPVPDFKAWFETISRNLPVRPGQVVHVEPGRSLTAQCGHLVSRVTYVKAGRDRQFAILDAGMNDLIRPALYQASHSIENLSSEEPAASYDIVGPVCESSDCWAHQHKIAACHRGDLLAIHSAGAYGQTMAMHYNQREPAPAVYSEDLKI